MQWHNTRERWGAIAQLLHWAIALAVFSLLGLGWVMVGWPISPTKFELYSLHKSLGMTVLALVLLRLAWRAVNITPTLEHSPAWERRTAATIHATLYGLLLVLPVSGYLINSAANFPLVIWGVLPLPNLTGENERLEAAAEAVHDALGWVLVTLVALHVAAALWHHWRLGDDVLRRMLPRRKGV